MKSKFVFLMYSMEQRVHSMKQKVQLVGERVHSLGQCRLLSDKRGFGMNELLGIAAAVILAAFIIIPGLKLFADSVMDGLTGWWNNTINDKIFPPTI